MKLRGIVTITALILAIIAVSTTTAAALDCSSDCDICVNQSGWWRDGGSFNASTTPIQAAVDNATAGETICVAAGNYNENVDITTPHLTLRGEGADVVTVTVNPDVPGGEEAGAEATEADPGDHVFEVTADYVNISGFTATGTGWNWAAGIYLGGASHCNISDNNCSNNGGDGGCGIYLSGSSNNLLVNNTADSNDYGIWLRFSSNYNLLVNNTASNNWEGIYLFSSSGNTLLNNTANSNGDDGIWLTYSDGTILVDNTADSNGQHGIYLDDSDGNTLTSNTANSNEWYGFVLYTSDSNTLTSNTASNNDRGIHMWSSSGNTFANNNCSNNTEWDIYTTGSDATFTDSTLNGTTISFTYGGDVSLKGVGAPAADPAGQQTIGKFINATGNSIGAWLLLNFSYSDDDLGSLNESDLVVWKYNGTTWLEYGWNGTRYLDTTGNVVGVNATSFSVFAPAAATAQHPAATAPAATSA